ncbi:TAP-like protein-domain-containing protein [Mycena capillaripes]|nr:TAP-like protein-domain-containing protein [Mycena capillaripes]
MGCTRWTGRIIPGLFLFRRGFLPGAVDYKISGAEAAETSQFSWENVAPSDTLEWSACYYGRYQCARLNVPLNYSEPHGKQAAIAMVRYTAAVPADSPLYRGPVLINPGGPGASGTNFVLAGGLQLAEVVGPEFDIVGFDPRGVGQSTPCVSFFDSNIERQIWGDPSLTELNASADALGRHWARARVYNRLAAERESIRHLNTDNTARDMLRIVRAHGKEKIQYWGFGYGSLLGAVYATMFPDKVERIVIDGVVDAEDYFETRWSNNLLDADEALQTFFDGCVAAGPQRCAFYASTPEAISKNLSALYESIRTRPVPVRMNPWSYAVVDLSLLRFFIFRFLLWPRAFFPLMADFLAAITHGEVFETMFPNETLECPCDAAHIFWPVWDPYVAIICNDGHAVPSEFDEAENHYQNMSKMSSWGSYLASMRIMCSGWPDIPKQHFQGPVTGNTSFPILLIGNTIDPMTPLSGAKKMSKAFPGSVVLTQDCTGHTSMAAPSPCTWGYVREYFYNGTLPEKGTVCPVLGSPFPDRRLVQEDTVFSVIQRAFMTVQPNTWSIPPHFAV